MQRLATLLLLAAVLLGSPAWAEALTTVVVIRHAEKKTVEGNDPHLTEAGRIVAGG